MWPINYTQLRTGDASTLQKLWIWPDDRWYNKSLAFLGYFPRLPNFNLTNTFISFKRDKDKGKVKS